MVPALSVVIITRNEEPYIAACLEAALAATANVDGCEIVVVDSNSTDRTIAIAERYPVRIVRLSASQRVCPAMGRYTGTRATTGRYVLFLDGDTTVDRDWVARAIQFLDARADAAGVAGREDQVYYRDGKVVGERPDYFQTGDADVTVRQFGGNAVYRRAALDQAGSFNPYVRSYEEAELGGRLRQAGWVLIRIPALMAHHHTPRPDAVAEYLRRVRNHLLTGQGQVLRLSLGQRVFWEHARALNRLILFNAWLAVGVAAAVIAAVADSVALLSLWLATDLVLLVLFMYRSRSFTKPFRMVFDWSVCSPPLLWGFLLRPLHADHFSLDTAVSSDTGDRRAHRSAAPR
jgi:glycosyltransferase involved in cell wall biosynthesis